MKKAIQSFGLDPQKKTILIVGGSLGARTINNCVMQGLEKIKNSGVQFIWQTGKFYINEAKATVAKAGEIPMLHTTDFISDMAAAYTAAIWLSAVLEQDRFLSFAYCKNQSYSFPRRM